MQSFLFLLTFVIAGAVLLRIYNQLLLLNNSYGSRVFVFDGNADGAAGQLGYHISDTSPLVHVPRNETSQLLTVEGEGIGCVYGTLDDTFPNTRLYLGIPYARPPVGSLRFAKPESLPPVKQAPHSMCLQADRYQAVCPQLEFYLRQSEDCLFLNIYTPSKARLRRRPFQLGLPVLVYFYGGAFVLGSGGEHKVYDASHIVEHNDVVVVTFNYRVGPLGFLGGNWGIYDQQTAVEWVKKNIDVFGGNNKNLILWGQSAGALSVLLHLTNPRLNASDTSVTKVILQSAPIGLLLKSENEALRIQRKFLQQNRCVDLDCLRRKPVFDVMATRIDEVPWKPGKPLSDILHWFPSLDGDFILEQVLDSIPNISPNVTVMMGTTEDELSIIPWILERSKTLGSNLITEVFKKYFPAVFGRDRHSLRNIFKHFHRDVRIPIRFDTVFDALSQMVFECPNQKLARLLFENANHVNIYRFQFQPDFLDTLGGVCSKDRICHAVDIPYFFHIYSQFVCNNSIHLYLSGYTSYAQIYR